MTIAGLEGLVENPEAYRNIAVGLQSTVPITLPLSGVGADTLWRILGTQVGPCPRHTNATMRNQPNGQRLSGDYLGNHLTMTG
jgi:hypothetical protein